MGLKGRMPGVPGFSLAPSPLKEALGTRCARSVFALPALRGHSTNDYTGQRPRIPPGRPLLGGIRESIYNRVYRYFSGFRVMR